MASVSSFRGAAVARLGRIFPGSGARARGVGAVLLLAVPLALVFGMAPIDRASAESGVPRSERPESARVYFITPTDGQKLSSPVVVRFGLSEMGVAPAGVVKEHTGHHHLVVDAELPAPDLPIPNSEHYRHFGKGQTETTLDLPKGKHTLQLVLGDHNHVPHDPPVVSKRITIEVE